MGRGKALPDLLSVSSPEENHVPFSHVSTCRLIATIPHCNISSPQMPIFYCIFFFRENLIGIFNAFGEGAVFSFASENNEKENKV